ncbi:MAG TPA: AEC family transporter [Thermoproteota archaeon]|nr:AEC family transporter [Thermoproteota archaeon]
MPGIDLQATQGVLTVIGLVGAGYLSKRANLLSQQHADLVLKIVLYVLLPLSVLGTYAQVNVPQAGLYVMATGAACNVIGLIVATYAAKRLTSDKSKEGAFVLAVSTMNSGLLGLAVGRLLFDELGVLTVLLLDLPNAFYTIVIGRTIASHYGSHEATDSTQRRLASFLATPYLYGVVLGVLHNRGIITVPAVILEIVPPISSLASFATLFAMGIYLSSSVNHWSETGSALLLRFGTGLFVFIAVTFLTPTLAYFPSEPLFYACTLPPAIMVLAHSRAYGLDIDLAAEILSLSLLLSVLEAIILVLL